ncbi:Spermidine/putrescine-binding periplasmic protein precursor [Clostridium sp. N3C]|uniref:extracellular solute-binding protein n=1 Tax=Clostridium sp. N3C TaxID=1776758 RepID=UPI00092E02A5|nr:extracellular solute-binding protein [Clostridium sp. N3C]SCN25243.1 Spermidine/putrescine-binding periplasmic protein precursor [Clostridium sp. N3C]
MKKNSKFSIVYNFIVYLFLYAPILILVLFSFNESKLNAVWTGFSLKWYKSLFTNETILLALKNTLIVAVVSTILSVMLGTITAVGMYRYKFRGKGILDAVLFIPIVIPEIVMGIAMLSFFSMLKDTFNFQMGLFTLIIAHVTFSVSYVVTVVRSRLEGFDKHLEEAAMDLGATPIQTFFKVTLPVIMPGIVSGGLLAFTLSLDDVIISFFVADAGSTTLPLKVLSMVKFGVTPEINALSTIMLLITVVIVVLMELLNKASVHRKKILKFACIFLVAIIGGSSGLAAYVHKGQSPQAELNVFNWSEYIPQSVIDKFEEEYSIKVNYSTFSSNEEMLAKLQAGSTNYDLVVASDYMVETLIKQDILQEINHDNIPNIKYIDPSVMNLDFDPGNKYSIPYMWGDAAIAVNTSKVDFEITGYKDLWNPKLANSIVVLDDQRAIIGMALKKLGYSINETDPNALAKAEKELLALKNNIKAYDSDSPKTLLINGEASVGFVWGAEVSLAMRENKDLICVVPEEGIFIQQDNFVIPKKSKNVKAAELFMDFIMRPEISVEISKAYPYANPNTAAWGIMDESILNDIAVYPPQEAIESGEHLKDIGNKIDAFDKIWSNVKK